MLVKDILYLPSLLDCSFITVQDMWVLHFLLPWACIPASSLYPAGPGNWFNWKLSDASQVSFLISSYKYGCLIFYCNLLTDSWWFTKLYKLSVKPSIAYLMLGSSELSRFHPYLVVGTGGASCAGWTADFVITTYSQKTNSYLHRKS